MLKPGTVRRNWTVPGFVMPWLLLQNDKGEYLKQCFKSGVPNVPNKFLGRSIAQ